MQIFFINLDKDTDRLERIQSQLDASGVSATRLPAVFWKELPQSQKDEIYSESLNHSQYYKPLANGEKGCYASHIKAWKLLLASEAASIVVLEDDVGPGPGFSDVVSAIEQLDRPWDMIKLLSRENEKIKSSQPLSGDYQLIEYQRVPSWTAGYVVSRSGAEKLLRSRIPFGRPIDVDLRFWFENDVHILGVYPSPIYLDETSDASSIWAGSQKDEIKISQRLKKFAMKLRMNIGYLLYRR